MLALQEASSRHSPKLLLPIAVQIALSSLLFKERSIWITAPLASTGLYIALQVLTKAPSELDGLNSFVESNRSSGQATEADVSIMSHNSAAATILARCHAHLVSMRTLVHALRGERECTGGEANNQIRGSHHEGLHNYDRYSGEFNDVVDKERCLDEGRVSRVLVHVLESRDGDPDGAWILHVSFKPFQRSNFSAPLQLFLLYCSSYRLCVQMSLEVLKAWPSVKQAWQAMHSGVNQIVVAVHVGIDEILELLIQTIGRQDFTELIFLRFPKVFLYLLNGFI